MRKILSLMIALVFCFALTPMAMGADDLFIYGGNGGPAGSTAVGTGGGGGFIGTSTPSSSDGTSPNKSTNDQGISGIHNDLGTVTSGGNGGTATATPGDNNGNPGNPSGGLGGNGAANEGGGGGGGNASVTTASEVEELHIKGGNGGADETATGGGGGNASLNISGSLSVLDVINVTSGTGGTSATNGGGSATLNVSGTLTANDDITLDKNHGALNFTVGTLVVASGIELDLGTGATVNITTIKLEGDLEVTGDLPAINLTVADKDLTLKGDLSAEGNKTVKFVIPAVFDKTIPGDPPTLGDIMLILDDSTLTANTSTTIEIELIGEPDFDEGDVILLVHTPAGTNIVGQPSQTTISAGGYSFEIKTNGDMTEAGEGHLYAQVVPPTSPRSSSSGGCSATGFAPFAVLALLGVAALRRRA